MQEHVEANINKLLKLYSKFSSTFSKHFLVFLCGFFFFFLIILSCCQLLKSVW